MATTFTKSFPSVAAFVLLLSLPLPAFSRDDSSHSFDIQEALRYIPSKAVGGIGFAVYFVISSLLSWRLVRNRDWWGLCLPIGGFFESLGFLLRIFNGDSKLRGSLGYYIAMNLCIVLAPATFLAFNYIMYGRLVRFCAGREHSYIRPEIVGRTFVISDVVTFLVQATGGSLQVQAGSAQAGKNIFLVGIILQGLSYVVYVGLVASSQHSIRRTLEPKGLGNVREQPWWKVFYLLYFSSVFIIIRSIYRVIETAQGRNGYLLTHEWCFLVLDSVPLALGIGIYTIYWPGDYIPKETSLSSDLSMLPLGSTQAQQRHLSETVH